MQGAISSVSDAPSLGPQMVAVVIVFLPKLGPQVVAVVIVFLPKPDPQERPQHPVSGDPSPSLPVMGPTVLILRHGLLCKLYIVDRVNILSWRQGHLICLSLPLLTAVPRPTADALTADALTGEALTADALTADALTADVLTVDALTVDDLFADGLRADALLSSVHPLSCLLRIDIDRPAGRGICVIPNIHIVVMQ